MKLTFLSKGSPVSSDRDQNFLHLEGFVVTLDLTSLVKREPVFHPRFPEHPILKAVMRRICWPVMEYYINYGNKNLLTNKILILDTYQVYYKRGKDASNVSHYMN